MGKLGNQQKVGTEGYPESLEVLVEGVKGQGEVDKKIRFLRRIPRDPFTNSKDWGKRSTQDDPTSTSWGGQNVFDIYSKTSEKTKDGTPYWTGKSGFTMIELLIVMAVITILVSMAVPFYQKSIIRSKESVLRNNLFTLRTVIDEYTMDKGKAPQTLQDLVSEGYLRNVPMDPMTGSDQSWKVIMEDAMTSVDQTEPGIFDVRSGSEKSSLEGTPYAEW